VKELSKILIFAVLAAFAAGQFVFAQSDDELNRLRQELQQLKSKIEKMEKGPAPASTASADEIKASLKEIEKRLDKVEKKTTLDKIKWSGDFRFEAHNIDATIPDHIDGMAMQNMIVNTLFYYQSTGNLPMNPADVQGYIAQHYGDYLYFTDNMTFDQLKGAMGMFPPAMQAQLMGMLAPYAYRPGYSANNGILYTNRLRLNMDAEVAPNVTFSGRLSMYKVWGDSTGAQVMNGQPNTFDIDGNTTGVPNGDQVRVERAYFTWNNIGGKPLYLSIGRRPSAGGPPMELRQDEMRGGTPMGSLIDFQFDGITFGWHINEKSTARLCYGEGYESGWGNGDILKQPGDRLSDAHFAGLNWDIYSTEKMLLQTTVARAYNVTDGFNGNIVLPVNPLTGGRIGAPVVLRYTPSVNLGDMDLAGLLLERRDGPVDWFVNFGYVKSHPTDVTTPFGGMFCDPFETPESHSGTMWYAGARYNFANEATKLGLEYNHGSKYWFNFTPAQDDILAPKTGTRGDVWELYLLHRIAKNFHVKLDYMHYGYDYSGSGWHMGTPKDLSETPMLGFPTYDKAGMWTLSLSAKF